MRTAAELNYAPNQAAKTLKNNITRKIMFCIPDLLNPYYFQMIRGVSDTMERYGYYTILAHSQHSTDREIQMIKAMNSRFVDGMILGSFDFSPRLMAEIDECRYPMVLTNLVHTGSPDSNYDCVYIDHIKAVYLATEHLIQRGHRNICLLGGSLSEQTGDERRQGYRAALKDYGVEYREELVVESDFTREGGYRDFQAFMQKRVPVTAVMACNDLMGISVMQCCREQNLRTPDDIAIATLDDTDYCLCAFPRLTSVRMMQYRIGEQSAALLMDNIRGERKEKRNMRIEPELVIRDST